MQIKCKFTVFTIACLRNALSYRNAKNNISKDTTVGMTFCTNKPAKTCAQKTFWQMLKTSPLRACNCLHTI